MRIQILALDGVFDTGLAAMLDAFGTANELAPLLQGHAPRLDIRLTGVRRSVRTFQGLSIPLAPLDSSWRPDAVLLPAIGYKMPQTLEPALGRRDVRDAGRVLQDASEQGTLVGAACIGTFVLAEAALLDGRDATTTWWLAPWFRQRYPLVRLDESRIVVRSGKVVTAGAALSHLDLALWLVRQASPELANLVAKYLVTDSRPSQAPYIIPDHLAHADPVVEKFERWARGQLAAGFSLDEAAQAAAVSKRTLARRLQAVLGKTPLAYFQDLRIERAAHLLNTTDLSVDHIAAAVGYSDGVTLRTLLRRKLGRGVRELRRRT